VYEVMDQRGSRKAVKVVSKLALRGKKNKTKVSPGPVFSPSFHKATC
jgi:hypothetical protein